MEIWAFNQWLLNDYGQQVYKATIPAAATGVIFNGGGAQTVDITTGIADDAQWYPTGEWENGKAKVGYVEPVNPTTAPVVETTAPETTVPETTTPDIKNVYVDFTNVTDAPGHAWFAWTWNDNEEGTWEYVQKYGYVAVKDNVLFANFESTEVERKWENVLAQTVDVAVKDMADDTLLYVKNGNKVFQKRRQRYKVLCSGRQINSLKHYQIISNSSQFIIATNGAEIYDTKNDRELFLCNNWFQT